MYKRIFKEIKKFDTVVIARHVGVDPDAMASQIALRDTIKLTFPEKRVLAVGTGSAKFRYIGNLDKLEDISDALLIVVDTPDKRRIDITSFDGFTEIIKIDHHPFIEKFGEIELIEDDRCSAAEIIMELIQNTKLLCNQRIAETLFIGLSSDSNRFLFNSCSPTTFRLVADFLEEYKFDMYQLYQKMYARPLKEVRLEGYMAEHMEVTEHGVGYMKVTDEIINKFKVDSASAGNVVNNFNFIEEVYIWVTITEDIKNEFIRISIRSRGPEINTIAEKYHGGGHKFASGVKLSTFEEAMLLIDDLDHALKEYLEKNEKIEEE